MEKLIQDLLLRSFALDRIKERTPEYMRPENFTKLEYMRNSEGLLEFQSAYLAFEDFFDRPFFEENPAAMSSYMAEIILHQTLRLYRHYYHFHPGFLPLIDSTPIPLDDSLPSLLLEHLPLPAVLMNLRPYRDTFGENAPAYQLPSVSTFSLEEPPNLKDNDSVGVAVYEYAAVSLASHRNTEIITPKLRYSRKYSGKMLIINLLDIRHPMNSFTLWTALDNTPIRKKIDNIYNSGFQASNIAKTTLLEVFTRVVNQLMYLVSREPDIDGEPTLPEPKKVRQGVRLFPVGEPQQLGVGVKWGRFITDHANTAEAVIQRSDDAAGYHVTPYWRPAHWHHYWTGPRNEPERRKLILHWIDPIRVNRQFDPPELQDVVYGKHVQESKSLKR